jgi:hypothetical protein
MIKELSTEQRGEQEWTWTHVYFVNMGGVRLIRKRLIRGQIRSSPLTARQLYAAVKANLIPVLPKIPLKEIEDRSKSDSFTKALALIQVMSLTVALITRAVRQLPVTQLEILAVAFAACTVTTYAFCWNKPQDAHTPFYMNSESNSPHSVGDISDLPSNNILPSLEDNSMVRYLLHPHRDQREGLLFLPMPNRIANDNFWLSESIVQPFGIISAMSTVSH